LRGRHFLREFLSDPAIVFATDLAFVKVGLRGVDGDQRDVDAAEFAVQAGVAGAEGVLVR
jgi:hypothetical protein